MPREDHYFKGKGDPRNGPGGGPGRPTKAWKDALAARQEKALEVLDEALAGKLKGMKWAAAQEVIRLTDPERGKQKLEVTSNVIWHINIPNVTGVPIPGVVSETTPGVDSGTAPIALSPGSDDGRDPVWRSEGGREE